MANDNAPSTDLLIEALLTDFRGEFQKAYEETPTIISKLATTVPSGSKSNTYGWMNQLPSMIEWARTSARTVKTLSSSGYQLDNITWEQTIGINVDDIEDDVVGVYSPMVQMAGQAAAKHPDLLLASLLDDNPDCFDGQPFFDEDHPVGNGTYSNIFYEKELNQENFIEAYVAMNSFAGDEGRKLNITPTLLVVPPALRAEATRILMNDVDGYGASNTTKGWAEMLVVPELKSATDWFLLDVSKPIKPFVFQVRQAAELIPSSATSHVVLEENEIRLYGKARYNVGVTLPFLAIKGTPDSDS